MAARLTACRAGPGVLALAGLFSLVGVALRAPERAPLLLVMALGAVALEAGSVRLSGAAVFNPALALYFAAALVEPLGWLEAASLAVLGAGWRSLIRGPAPPLPEYLRDVLPILAAQAAVAAGRPAWPAGAALGGLLAYAALGLLLRRAGEPAWLLPTAAGATGAATALLYGVDPGAALLGLAALAGLRQAVAGIAGLKSEPGPGQAHLVAESQGLGERIRRQAGDHLILEQLARDLARAPGMDETLEAVLQTASRLVAARTVAVFLEQAGKLVPVRCHGPDRSRLQSAALLGLEEPLVELAFGERATRQRAEAQRFSPRLFQGEPVAVAVPIRDLGVLYAGRGSPVPFEPEQVRLLEGIACHATLAIRSARRQEIQQEALDMLSGAHQKLEKWASGLDILLEAARELASCLDLGSLLARLEKHVDRLVPHESHVLRVECPEEKVLSRGTSQDAGAVISTICAHRRPLLVDDLSGSRFAPLAPGQSSLLAVPLLGDEGPLGALVLGQPERGAFTREHQDRLLLLAYLAAASLNSAALHARTVEAYRQLRESQAHLVQSSKLAAVGQLAAGVAHELNNPLGALLLAVGSARIRLGSDPDLADSKLETASRAIRRCQSIVEKLLYYSRDARAARRSADLNKVIADTLELMGHQLEIDGIRLDLDLGPIPPVVCQEHQVQQVVMNLLLNARDAVLTENVTPREIRIRTRVQASQLVLEVANPGPGIPAVLQERIFEPFFTTKPVGKGTGLGLWVSREIVLGHGGTLEVASEENRGAVFTVRIPLEGASPGGRSQVRAPGQGPTAAAGSAVDEGAP